MNEADKERYFREKEAGHVLPVAKVIREYLQFWPSHFFAGSCLFLWPCSARRIGGNQVTTIWLFFSSYGFWF